MLSIQCVTYKQTQKVLPERSEKLLYPQLVAAPPNSSSTAHKHHGTVLPHPIKFLHHLKQFQHRSQTLGHCFATAIELLHHCKSAPPALTNTEKLLQLTPSSCFVSPKTVPPALTNTIALLHYMHQYHKWLLCG